MNIPSSPRIFRRSLLAGAIALAGNLVVNANVLADDEPYLIPIYIPERPSVIYSSASFSSSSFSSAEFSSVSVPESIGVVIDSGAGSIVESGFRGEIVIAESQISVTPLGGSISVHSDLPSVSIHLSEQIYFNRFIGRISVDSDGLITAQSEGRLDIRADGYDGVFEVVEGALQLWDGLARVTYEAGSLVTVDTNGGVVKGNGGREFEFGGDNNSRAIICGISGCEEDWYFCPGSCGWDHEEGPDLELIFPPLPIVNPYLPVIKELTVSYGEFVQQGVFEQGIHTKTISGAAAIVTNDANINLELSDLSAYVEIDGKAYQLPKNATPIDFDGYSEAELKLLEVSVRNTFDVAAHKTLSSRGDGLMVFNSSLSAASFTGLLPSFKRNENSYTTYTLSIPESATLEAILNDSHNSDTAFYEADYIDLADNATIKINGSASDYTLPENSTEYVIVEADELNADQSKLNLTSEGLIDVEFAAADNNKISVVVSAQNLAEIATGLGGSNNDAAAAKGLQSVLAAQGGSATGEQFYQLAMSLRDNGSFEQLAPVVENISGQTIRGTDAQAASQVGNLLQGYRGGASGDTPVASGFWLQGLRSDGEQDSIGDANGFDVKSNGYALGADIELAVGLTAGFAISYAESQVDIEQSLDRQSSDGYTGSLYGQYLFDNGYYSSAIVSYGQTDNDSRRWVANEFAEADFDSDIASLRFATGKKIELQQWLLQPRVEYNYSDINIDSYTETGSLGALSVAKQDYKISELGLGGSVGRDFEVAKTILRPELQLMYYHDFQQDGVLITSAFTAGGSNFVTTGADPDAERYNVKLAVSWIFSDNQSLRASYDYNASDNFSGNTWLADYRYDF